MQEEQLTTAPRIPVVGSPYFSNEEACSTFWKKESTFGMPRKLQSSQDKALVYFALTFLLFVVWSCGS